jgi:hypothetical protein
MSHRPVRRVLAASVFVLLIANAPARAAIGVGGGVDGYAGPGGERSSTVLGFATIGQERAALALGALRFDDNLVGDGYGGLGVVALPLGPTMLARVWGTRFVGSDTFRAWRVKAGPEFQLGADRTLGVYLLHDESSIAGVSNGATAELGVPLAAGLTGRLTGGMAGVRDAPEAIQGTLGVSWQPQSRFEITAEAGVAHNGGITQIPVQHGRGGGPLGLPLFGSNEPQGSETTSTTRTEGVFSAGLRVYFP